LKVGRSDSKTKRLLNATGSGVDKKVEGKPSPSFSGFIEKVEEQNGADKIKRLMERIFDSGEKLGKTIDLKELRIYKGLVQEFLNEVVNHSHKYVKSSQLDRRGRHKVFVTIQKINVELDSLTKEMLEQQGNGIKILKKIQDIRGLLLDLKL
jgi:uncharacterized protein